MKKSLPILLTVTVFATTVITTIHSVADFQEHFIHLLVLGTISLLFILYVFKDSIALKDRMAIITVVLLFAFCTIRVFSCHLITSNPQDIASATIINNPCCSAVIDAVPAITVAPVSETVTPIKQKPVIAQIQTIFQSLTNKSPPTFFA
jgi:hypothetical protein